VLVWDNLNVHRRAELRAFTDAQAWLRVFRLPAYAPDLNPAEMGLTQCELRRSPHPWLPGSLSVEVPAGVPSSVQRRRLW
jgi:transposase